MTGEDYLTQRPIGHDEGRQVAQRLVNSHFHQEPQARVTIPARPDCDDDLLITAYIEQRRAAEAAAAERIAELGGMLERLEGKTADLEKLVYVPGLWRCAKCEFSLLQSNLNARDGSVTVRDEPGDRCPNCQSPLWRVTERRAGNDLADRLEAELERRRLAEAALRATMSVLQGLCCAGCGAQGRGMAALGRCSRDADCDAGWYGIDAAEIKAALEAAEAVLPGTLAALEAAATAPSALSEAAPGDG
jgi:hypothetical protein